MGRRGENGMIAYIQGEVAEISEQAIIIEVNGIGYEVICPNPYQFQTQLKTKDIYLSLCKRRCTNFVRVSKPR